MRYISLSATAYHEFKDSLIEDIRENMTLKEEEEEEMSTSQK